MEDPDYEVATDGSKSEKDFFQVLAENEAQLSSLIAVITENYVKYKNATLEEQSLLTEKQILIQKTTLRDRTILTLTFVGAIVIIFVIIAYLTIEGRFDGTTLAFFLGTSVGSLLTILGKVFSPKG